MASTFDFDAALAEHAAAVTPPVVEVRGELVTLPARLPAIIVLFFERARLDPEGMDQEVRGDEVVKLAGSLFGPARVERWLEGEGERPGMEQDQLAFVLWTSIGLYVGTAELPDAEGKARAATGSPAT